MTCSVWITLNHWRLLLRLRRPSHLRHSNLLLILTSLPSSRLRLRLTKGLFSGNNSRLSSNSNSFIPLRPSPSQLLGPHPLLRLRLPPSQAPRAIKDPLSSSSRNHNNPSVGPPPTHLRTPLDQLSPRLNSSKQGPRFRPIILSFEGNKNYFCCGKKKKEKDFVKNFPSTFFPKFVNDAEPCWSSLKGSSLYCKQCSLLFFACPPG